MPRHRLDGARARHGGFMVPEPMGRPNRSPSLRPLLLGLLLASSKRCAVTRPSQSYSAPALPWHRRPRCAGSAVPTRAGEVAGIMFRLLSAVPTFVGGVFLLMDFILWAVPHEREMFCISVQGWWYEDVHFPSSRLLACPHNHHNSSLSSHSSSSSS